MYIFVLLVAIVAVISVCAFVAHKHSDSSEEEITPDDIKRFFAGYDDHDHGFPCEANDKFYVLGYNSSKNFSAEIVEKFEDLSSKLR